MISLRLSSLINKMQFIGIIEHAVSETWDSNFCFIDFFDIRMDKSIEDFDKAIELDP